MHSAVFSIMHECRFVYHENKIKHYKAYLKLCLMQEYNVNLYNSNRNE